MCRTEQNVDFVTCQFYMKRVMNLGDSWIRAQDG